MKADNPQGELDLCIERQRDVRGVGMGVLSDGTPFLSGRGLARLLDIENLHVRTISQEWNKDPLPPRIASIKSILKRMGYEPDSAHIPIMHGRREFHAYPDYVCLAVLEHYTFEAAIPREKARDNYRLLAGKGLRDLIYQEVGYDPTGNFQHRFDKWHERLALNFKAAPNGYFHVFNEAGPIIYELILAGADIGEKFIVDISVGRHWSKYWTDNNLDAEFGERQQYTHNYPDSHPQSKANPHKSWCYPNASLGAYRDWLQSVYLEGGKFKGYIDGKVRKKELPPSVAQLALTTLVPPALPAN